MPSMNMSKSLKLESDKFKLHVEMFFICIF